MWRSAFRRLFFVLTIGVVLSGPHFGKAISAGGLPAPAETRFPLFGTWEIVLSRQINDLDNPFDMDEVTLNVEVEGPNGRHFNVLGFFDGPSQASAAGIWRARIMPNTPGRWCANFTWSVASQPEANRCIDVTEHAPPGNHGHVRIRRHNSTNLVHDDGTPHYWIGGKWFGAQNYAACELDLHKGCYSDTQILEYLDVLQEYEHNGILVKLALFPLLDNGISWNLKLVRRAEWLVIEAGRRGIYVQLNLFDTWSRAAGKGLEVAPDGNRHVLNAWDQSRLADKRNYLRTAISRFAGFFNVYWELGNEMDHAPNCGGCFLDLANRYYLPWIRATDPYGLPIGLSHERWMDAAVDIGFLHHINQLPDASRGKLTIMNELVPGATPWTISHLWSKGSRPFLKGLRDAWRSAPGLWAFLKGLRNYRWAAPALWRDQAIRDPWHRYDYRRTFWQMFTSGGSGSSEATWLRLTTPLNDAVLQVMADHRALADFRRKLPLELQSLPPNPDRFALEGMPGMVTGVGSGHRGYVAYIAAGHSKDLRASTASLRSPPGTFIGQWIEPRSLRVLQEFSFEQDLVRGTTTVQYPEFREDLILLLTRDQ